MKFENSPHPNGSGFSKEEIVKKIKVVLLTITGIVLMPVGVVMAVAIGVIVWTLLSSIGILPTMVSDTPMGSIIALSLFAVMTATSLLFHGSGHKEFEGWVPLFVFPKWRTLVPEKLNRWSTDLPDWLQPAVIGFGGLALVILPYLVLLMAMLFFLEGIPAVFVGGWYFCWLTTKVRSGEIRFWPWLVERIHKATASSAPQNGAT